jgi:hypothetical protein
MLKKLKTAFASQKNHARQRGIPFLLTFDEWYKFWFDSGFLHLRGRGIGKYCMARFGDKGPYALGNIKIITFCQNTVEGNIGKPISEKQIVAIKKANTGKKHTKEHRAKITVIMKNFRHSNISKAQISESLRNSWARRKA